MLHIEIIQVSKTKDQYFIDAEKEFTKRLSPYAKIRNTIIEVKKSGQDVKKIIEKESDSIMKHIRDDMFVIVLDVKGDQYASEEFADLISELSQRGKVTFIIGGPYGVSQKVLDRADIRLSFSKMTFTHQMIRVFLLEQIYRGFTIMKGKSYHY